jgi:hypothetical protein
MGTVVVILSIVVGMFVVAGVRIVQRLPAAAMARGGPSWSAPRGGPDGAVGGVAG